MTSPNILMWANATKQHLIQVYVGAGPSSGFEVAQRMTREIGEVVCEMHGRDKAAVLIYGVADALATKGELPKLPFTAPEVTLPSPLSTTQRLKAFWLSKSSSWLLRGVIAGIVLAETMRGLAGSP